MPTHSHFSDSFLLLDCFPNRYNYTSIFKQFLAKILTTRRKGLYHWAWLEKTMHQLQNSHRRKIASGSLATLNRPPSGFVPFTAATQIHQCFDWSGLRIPWVCIHPNLLSIVYGFTLVGIIIDVTGFMFIDKNLSHYIICYLLFLNLKGTITETRYLLMGYGIPVDQLPMTSSGRTKVGSLPQWLNVRTIIEKQRFESGAIFAEDISSNIIECPRLNDVAIRPGKAYLCHPGNVRFKELLDKYMDEHAAANRRGKDIISWAIIEEIERSNGRFLEWDNKSAMWIQNKDRNIIRARIPIYFRDHKRNVRAKRQRQNQRNVAVDSNDCPDGPIGSMDPLESYEKKRKIMDEDNTFKCCLNASFFEDV